MNTLETQCITTLRMLSVDAVEKANSGHPGLPLGCAAIAHTIWSRFLQHDPKNPQWINRDRFILSAGHGSALLYALLHVYGYDLSLEDLQNFRQWHSKTPGHPEYGETPGVEATTGPLGQGFAMGVGMAMAERYLSAQYNKEDSKIIDHYVYALVSDGDLMEGVTAEAASLAGHLQLNKLIYLYDDNNISIDGNTNITFTENVEQRFLAYNWHVTRVADGNDCDAIAAAISEAKQQDKPSLIIVKTHIGYGSPKQDTAKVHGSPLGSEAIQATRDKFSWPQSDFHVPQEVKEEMQKVLTKCAEQHNTWQEKWKQYSEKYPECSAKLDAAMHRQYPENWSDGIADIFGEEQSMATRAASGKVINFIAERLPQFLGGSADLAGSNKTDIKSSVDFSVQQQAGRNIRFGIREHAMGSIVNGMSLHQGVVAFSATFLAFADYMRPAIRLAALMKTPSIFVFTHDSIALGEDGPTHQPVEQLMSLRLIPDLLVMRPADALETAIMWREAVTSTLPSALCLTRQGVTPLAEYASAITANAAKGAYTLCEDDNAQVILIATGSEVGLALDAKKKLGEESIPCRIVSMPCWELFAQQSPEYRESVLPNDVPKISIEAGSTLGWQSIVGNSGATIGIDTFGASAPWEVLYDKFGFNVQNVLSTVKQVLGK
ncbi:transketolase [Candidatus Uabimicrobium amorphum]|uniref:Transketolase n=1 Tax=Uabimicrobium amorphum TaxID=2596890 RepID=A0A5S9IJS1_UABAM|nr:transketolase [Candidatus Uabimicrobium amorphum]BBM81895.1 transketolase [Candidatus Uabimicrobium amorphum]